MTTYFSFLSLLITSILFHMFNITFLLKTTFFDMKNFKYT